MILHDINLTARYADYLFAIKEGKLVAEGKPEDILNDKLVKDIFNLEAKKLYVTYFQFASNDSYWQAPC